MQRSFKVSFDEAFEHGAFQLGEVVPVRDFDRSTKERPVQAVDEDGVPLWAVEVIDGDPSARQRVVKVKIAARHQPVPPPVPEGMILRPVVLEDLYVTPYVDTNGPRPKLALSLKAGGMRAAGRPAKPSASPAASASSPTAAA